MRAGDPGRAAPPPPGEDGSARARGGEIFLAGACPERWVRPVTGRARRSTATGGGVAAHWAKLASAVTDARRVADRRAAEDALVGALQAEVHHILRGRPDAEDRAQDAILRLVEALEAGGESIGQWCRVITSAPRPGAEVRRRLNAALGRRGGPRDACVRSVEDKIRRIAAADATHFHIRRDGQIATRRVEPPQAPIPWPPEGSEAGGSFRHAPDAVYAAWLHFVLATEGPQRSAALAARIARPVVHEPFDFARDDDNLAPAEVLPSAAPNEDTLVLFMEYRRLTEELSPTDNRVVRRVVEEGLSVQEAARAEGVTAHRVRSLLAPRRRGSGPGAGNG